MIGFCGTLEQFVCSDIGESIHVLEINEAGGLTPVLAKLPHHQLVHYPEFDMTNLSLESSSFDLVLHSDSLEHVPDPVAGLAECRRVLKPTGRCLFTVPVIVGRLGRSRAGMKKSYHGFPDEVGHDYIVYTEFGADVWTVPLKAGFGNVRIHSYEYPSALAIEATVR